jgi:hypothetical protein
MFVSNLQIGVNGKQNKKYYQDLIKFNLVGSKVERLSFHFKHEQLHLISVKFGDEESNCMKITR